jgi:ribose 1,5-bisphosphokinase
MACRGTLILVVGPSGVGKDSIIAGVAARLRGDARAVFAQRVITRPAAVGGEDHLAATPSEFAAWRDAGRLMLDWQAHGLDYGLPRALEAELDAGRSVIANVSRAVAGAARQRFAPIVVAAASAEALAARLAARGREDAADMRRRLARADPLPTQQADIVIDNDGPLDKAIDRFVEVVRAALGQPESA